ncbi:MAG TPA: alpha/beta fold hydrolase, partial [Candidatus Binatia bacterium]|nr:alpha/beta fold hydrolase [Candidatus Binatia bacterium]
ILTGTLENASSCTNSTKTDSTVVDSNDTNCNVTSSTEINVLCTNSNITNSTKINSTVINSTNLDCLVTNSTEINTQCTNSNITNSTKLNSTNTNCVLSSTFENSSTCTNSTKTGSIVVGSTDIDCTVTNSTEINTFCQNSTVTNSTKVNSSNVNCAIASSFENNTFCLNSNKTGSIDINSNITNSTITNSTLINCTVTNSVVNNSVKKNCVILDSIIISSNNTNATIINSTEINSTDINAFVNASTILKSVKNNTNITDSTVTNSTLNNCIVTNSSINSSTKTNCTITGSVNNGCFVFNSTELDTFCLNSTKRNSTNIGCTLSKTFENSSTCINSTKSNSTVVGSTDNDCRVANSTETNSVCTNSSKTFSIVINSTNTNCIVTNSSEIGARCTNSNLTNTTKINSNNTNCVIQGSFENLTTCTNSTKTNSIDQNSTITNSTVTNSTIIGCTVTDSTVIGSIKKNCTITNSIVIGSNNTNATIIDSVERNSTDNATLVINSSIVLSKKFDSTINASNLTDSKVNGTTITNSTIINSNVTNSNLTDCTVINSTVSNANLNGCSIINTIYPLLVGVNITAPASGSTTLGSPTGYTITIGNNGTVPSTYNLTVSNPDNASTATLSAYNITLAPGTTGTVTLSLTDEDVTGAYAVTVTAVLSTDSSINATTGTITTTVNAPPANGGGATPCDESWSCTAWSTCTNYLQGRTCTDANNCGTTQSKPAESQSCTPCVESWLCDDWGPCIGGTQTRDCSDLSSCGTNDNEPAESQSCSGVIETPTPVGGNTAITCGSINRSSGTAVEATRSAVDITSLIPRGYQLATKPFKLSCAGDTLDLTVEVPDTFKDLKVLRCTATTCQVEQLSRVDREAQTCGNRTLRSRTSAETLGERGVISPEGLTTFISAYKDLGPRDNVLRDDGYSFAVIDTPVSVRLLGLTFPIPEPANPSLVVLGTPLVVDLAAAPNAKLPVTITMPVSQSKGVERGSVAVYALENGEWTYLGGTQVGDHISVKLADFRTILDGKRAVLATLGVTCTACEIAEFQRAYHAPDTRTAIVLVHGAFSNKNTYNFMIDDFRTTQQPFDVWTYDYPTNLSLEELGTNLADALLLNSNRYDNYYLVGHSAGGLIVQEALHVAYDRKDATIPKVRKAVLVGSPTLGSPTVDTVNNLLNWLVGQRTVTQAFNLNSRLVQDTITGRIIPRVPSINYQVIAGTQSYAFNAGLFRVGTNELVQFTMKNDGIITTQSAQRVGEDYVNNPCKNYYELNLTHTALIDDPLGIHVVERIITTDIGKSTPEQPLVGQDQYVQFSILDCNSNDEYAIVGKPLHDEERYDPTMCSCGNGWCGEGETPENCPVDCAAKFSLQGFCATMPAMLSVIAAALAVIVLTFIIRHYMLKRELGRRWLYTGAASTLVSLALYLILSGVCSLLPLALLIGLLALAGAYIVAIFIEKLHRHGLPPLPKKPIHIPHEEHPFITACKGVLLNMNKLLAKRGEETHKKVERSRAEIEQLNREIEALRKKLKKR